MTKTQGMEVSVVGSQNIATFPYMTSRQTKRWSWKSSHVHDFGLTYGPLSTDLLFKVISSQLWIRRVQQKGSVWVVEVGRTCSPKNYAGTVSSYNGELSTSCLSFILKLIRYHIRFRKLKYCIKIEVSDPKRAYLFISSKNGTNGCRLQSLFWLEGYRLLPNWIFW